MFKQSKGVNNINLKNMLGEMGVVIITVLTSCELCFHEALKQMQKDQIPERQIKSIIEGRFSVNQIIRNEINREND